ncbi:MAG: diguanylate cyclase [Anaerovoracaceae bacterium]
MDKKKKRIIICLVVVALAAVSLISQSVYIYNSNNAKLEAATDSSLFRQRTNEENEKLLREVVNMKLASEEKKLEAMTKLATVYYLKQDYALMIKTSIQAIYEAEKKENFYYAAYNYMNMSEVFMMLYEFDMAEELIEKALSYDVKNKEEKQWIMETAYIYLGEIKAREGKHEEAIKYIDKSMDYECKDAYDHIQMLIKRNAIKAEIAFDKGYYLYAKSLLDKFENERPEESVLLESVYFPVEEIYAKILIASGETEEGFELCDKILDEENQNSYLARRLTFLTELSELAKDIDFEKHIKYSNMALEAYDDVMYQNAQFMGNYIFNIYSEEYIKNEEHEKRNFYIFSSIVAVILILNLAWLAYRNKRRSLIDPLTNLYNRRFFDSIYGKYVKKPRNLGVIMLDIDHFKNINDTYGHEFGDEVIKAISKVCSTEKPIQSIAFRMGGEEFCILCRCEKVEEAAAAAEHLRACVEKLEWENGVRVTVSGGVAFAGQSEDLYDLADRQLYISKNSGRNRINYVGIS